MYEKLNFSGFVVLKGCRVTFCLVLQFTANDLGSRRSVIIHSNKLLVFAPMVFLFLLCILIWIFYSEENNQYHQPIKTSQYMRRRLILSVRCILSAQNSNKNTIDAKNQEPVGMNHCSFTATQEVCSKVENQAKCNSAVFCNKSAENSFFARFDEVAIIARTIVPSLFKSCLVVNSCHSLKNLASHYKN